MALIRLGPLLADARGAVGGVVFARGYGGNYIRNRTKPVYPASPKQNQRTALMSTLVAHWQGTLTAAQRLNWNYHGSHTTLRNRLGDDFSPSGFNLYARCNFMLDLTNQTLVTVPPTAAVTPAIPATMDYLEGTGCRVTSINAFDTTVGGKFMVQHSANLPQSRFFFKGPWNALRSFAVTDLDALPWTCVSEANCDQGKRNWMRFVMVTAAGSVSADTIYYVDRAAA